MRNYLLDGDIFIDNRVKKASSVLSCIEDQWMFMVEAMINCKDAINSIDGIVRISSALEIILDKKKKELDAIKEYYYHYETIVSEFDNDVDSKINKIFVDMLLELRELRPDEITVDSNYHDYDYDVDNPVQGTHEIVENTYHPSFANVFRYGDVEDVLRKQYNALMSTGELDEDETLDGYVYKVITDGDVHFETTFEKVTSEMINLIPYVGQAKQIIETLTGKDLISGQEIDTATQVINILTFGAGVGGLFDGFDKAATLFTKEGIVEFGKDTIEDFVENIKDYVADKFKTKVEDVTVDMVVETMKEMGCNDEIISRVKIAYTVITSGFVQKGVNSAIDAYLSVNNG